MKSFCVVALALVGVSAAAYTSDAEVDIVALTGNEAEVKQFLECFTDKAECSPIAAGIKHDLPDALGSACSKCTPDQKHNTKLFLEAVKKFFPAEYKGLQQKYDAGGKLFPALDAAIAAY